MTQYLLMAVQMASGLAGIAAAYSAYRARDNERAVTLTELRADIKALKRQMDGLQRRFQKLSEEKWDKQRGIA